MEKGIAGGVGSAQNAGKRPARELGESNGEGEQHPPTGNAHPGSSAHGGAKNVTERGTEGAAGGVRRNPPSLWQSLLRSGGAPADSGRSSGKSVP
jgi:hypothetical protein